jgi:[ribosomal protein S18]-alanine N-acetyltransferase
MLTIARPNIRVVRPDDIEAVAVLEQTSFKDPYPTYFLSQLARDNPETFLVATLNSVVVGYAVIDRWEDHDHLISIAVHPDSRRKGLGEGLLMELEKRRTKARPLKLEVRQSNSSAIELYLKNGFLRTGLAEGYYSDGEDAITMEKGPLREAMIENQSA